MRTLNIPPDKKNSQPYETITRKLKMAVFLIVMPCRLIEINRRFRCACCSNIKAMSRPDDGGSNTSETPANIYQTTRRNNSEDSHLHTRRRENLKSHLETVTYMLVFGNIY
jgi:hypothetical protein